MANPTDPYLRELQAKGEIGALTEVPLEAKTFLHIDKPTTDEVEAIMWDPAGYYGYDQPNL